MYLDSRRMCIGLLCWKKCFNVYEKYLIIYSIEKQILHIFTKNDSLDKERLTQIMAFRHHQISIIIITIYYWRTKK